jgi:hypothetical protein
LLYETNLKEKKKDARREDLQSARQHRAIYTDGWLDIQTVRQHIRHRDGFRYSRTHIWLDGTEQDIQMARQHKTQDIHMVRMHRTGHTMVR